MIYLIFFITVVASAIGAFLFGRKYGGGEVTLNSLKDTLNQERVEREAYSGKLEQINKEVQIPSGDLIPADVASGVLSGHIKANEDLKT